MPITRLSTTEPLPSGTSALAMPPPILILDDDPVFHAMLRGSLKSRYTVSCAEEAGEALTQAVRNPPALFIVDVMLAGQSGLEFVRNIRRQSALKQTPILMLTGDASRATVVAAVEAGADDYLLKTGLKRALLLEKVERLLRKSAVAARPQSKPSPAPAPLSNQEVCRLLSETREWEF